MLKGKKKQTEKLIVAERFVSKPIVETKISTVCPICEDEKRPRIVPGRLLILFLNDLLRDKFEIQLFGSRTASAKIQEIQNDGGVWDGRIFIPYHSIMKIEVVL